MTSFCIDILNEQNQLGIDIDQTQIISQKILKLIFEDNEIIKNSALNNINISQKEVYIDILVCDNEKIHDLNNVYRQKDKPTDVLTFALFSDSPNLKMAYDNNISLGSIVLSAEYIENQAKEYNRSYDEEFYFLLSHGFLHLLGFCHDDEKSLEYMVNLQNNLVKKGLK